MPLRKPGRDEGRFRQDYAPKLKLVEHIRPPGAPWSALPGDAGIDCGDDACLSRHEQETDLIKNQIVDLKGPHHPDDSGDETAYLEAIQELNASLPDKDVLIKWAQSNLPPQSWFDDEEDLFKHD